MTPSAPPPTPLRRRRRWKRWVLLALLAALPLLLLSRAPVAARADPPTAADVTAARDVYQRVRVARSSNPRHVEVSWEELRSVALLGGRAAGLHHVATSIDAGRGRMAMSVPLGLGFWLNGQFWVKPGADGAPRISGRIGRLPVPAVVAHAGIATGRLALRLRGASIPPLDTMVSALTVDERGLAATLALPEGSRIVGTIGELQTGGVEPRRVEKHYCHLRQLQKKNPDHDLAVQVRRGFGNADGTAADNRAVFIALAMLVAGRDMKALPDGGRGIFQQCGWPSMAIQLQGRNDLALHWSVSGALTAVLGSQVSNSLGTWKEIADSADGGSGFSLIDLAADRSGTHCAEKAAVEATAKSARSWLAGVSAQDLLPVPALALAEGMSEEEFRARFASTESDEFAATVDRIDASLAVLLRF